MSNTKTFSFELFPPKTDKGFDNLKNAVNTLNELNPEFFSVTYGAGGSTQTNTYKTVDWLRENNIETAPHLSCIGSSREEILDILNRYRNQGIKRIVALRGDLPSGAGLGGLGDLNHANELVELIRSDFGQEFFIEVAAYPETHPQAVNAKSDIDYLKKKADAGANSAITQYFYNADAYLAFIDSCSKADINIPIVPGIMPITNYVQLARFSEACGAEIPRWIRKRLEGYGDDLASIQAFGQEVVTQMCQRLIDNDAPGLHFYTMNKSAPTLAVWNDLKLS